MSSRVIVAPDEVVRDGERQSSVRDDIRGRVDRKVGEEIARETDHTVPEEQAEVESVARDMKAKSVDGLRRSERQLGTGRRLKRIYQFIAYAFYVVYGLIGLMLGLVLIGARAGSQFMQVMTLVTTPILAPFRNVLSDPAVGGGRLMMSYALALVVYGLVHLAIKGIFRVLVHRDGTEL
jgi:uncharacterized protein YggT (Ycf19 family)